MIRGLISSTIWHVSYAIICIAVASSLFLWSVGVGSADGALQKAAAICLPPYGAYRGIDEIRKFINLETKKVTP